MTSSNSLSALLLIGSFFYFLPMVTQPNNLSSLGRIKAHRNFYIPPCFVIPNTVYIDLPVYTHSNLACFRCETDLRTKKNRQNDKLRHLKNKNAVQVPWKLGAEGLRHLIGWMDHLRRVCWRWCVQFPCPSHSNPIPSLSLPLTISKTLNRFRLRMPQNRLRRRNKFLRQRRRLRCWRIRKSFRRRY